MSTKAVYRRSRSVTTSLCCPCCSYRIYPDRASKRSMVEEALGMSALSVSTVITKSTFPLPLNEREIFLLVSSWKTINKHMIEIGMRMFVRMFETSPESKAVFEKFRKMDTSDELWKSGVLKVHGMVVMNAMDEIINNLDDQAIVVELILQQGRSHAKFGDDISESVFWAIEEPFLEAVKEAMSSHYKKNIDKIYRKIIRYVLALLIIGFRQIKRKSSFIIDDDYTT